VSNRTCLLSFRCVFTMCALLRPFAFLSVASAIIVNNSAPMLDATGAILDCADSTYTFTQSKWFAVCVSYGKCVAPVPLGCTVMPDMCGHRLDHNVSIFSSPDLSSGSWVFERFAFPYTERPTGILYRPHVVFNAFTTKWVMWCNIFNPGVFQGYFAASAASIEGPYAVDVPAINVTRTKCGDFDLLVDSDGTGYIIYSCGHVMGIEELTNDFLSSTGRVSAPFPTYFVEAPVIFRRGATYFALFSWCCCFCKQGSGAMVHTASTALGPWSVVNSTALPDGDVVCARPLALAPTPKMNDSDTVSKWGLPSPADTPNQGCAYINAGPPRFDVISTARSQQNSLIHLSDGRIVWTGNRWGQAPDGIKGHEGQAWLPLLFSVAGAIEPLVWLDSWEL
jgi:hypothetical protein